MTILVIDNDIDPTCRLCEDGREDSEHIITECDALWKIRSDAFGKPFLDFPPAWTPSELIQFLRNPKVKNLESTAILDNSIGVTTQSDEEPSAPNSPSN